MKKLVLLIAVFFSNYLVAQEHLQCKIDSIKVLFKYGKIEENKYYFLCAKYSRLMTINTIKEAMIADSLEYMFKVGKIPKDVYEKYNLEHSDSFLTKITIPAENEYCEKRKKIIESRLMKRK